MNTRGKKIKVNLTENDCNNLGYPEVSYYPFLLRTRSPVLHGIDQRKKVVYMFTTEMKVTGHAGQQQMNCCGPKA